MTTFFKVIVVSLYNSGCANFISNQSTWQVYSYLGKLLVFNNNELTLKCVVKKTETR